MKPSRSGPADPSHGNGAAEASLVIAPSWRDRMQYGIVVPGLLVGGDAGNQPARGDVPELAARVSVVLAGHGHRLDEDV